jgi:hypothetical protein
MSARPTTPRSLPSGPVTTGLHHLLGPCRRISVQHHLAEPTQQRPTLGDDKRNPYGEPATRAATTPTGSPSWAVTASRRGRP